MRYIKLNKLVRFLFSPNSENKDIARREFIVNILLVGSLFLSSIAVTNASLSILRTTSSEWGTYLWVYLGLWIIFLIFFVGYLLSRAGKANWGAYILVAIYLLGAFYTGYAWGADAPQSLLTYALIIVMSGILISSRFAFFITGTISLLLIVLVYFQRSGSIIVDESWKKELPSSTDPILFSATLFIIAIVSWLFNREMEKALNRARLSEAAVKKQRDQLEILVERRTQELQIAQTEKIAQLSRFAQFGRIASGLFHDLANPINLVSLNLDRLNRQNKTMDKQKISDAKILLQRAITGTQRLESFVGAARKQMQSQEVLQVFSLNKEITQVDDVLEYKAKKFHIRVLVKLQKNIKTFGNPIKFNQLITNLLLNSIDAYEGIGRKEKTIEVRVQKIKDTVKLQVQDWGIGIRQGDKPKIFDPLFTTKAPDKGMGMGLYICKAIVEKDFKGSCTLESKEGEGTTVTITFPLRRV